MTIQVDTTHHLLQVGATLWDTKEYEHDTEYCYTLNLEGKEVDIRVIEEREDPDTSTFELYYQGRFISSGELKEFGRIKSVVENTLRIIQ